MIELYGRQRFLEESDVTVIHTEPGRRLLELHLDHAVPPLCYVEVVCPSTGKIHLLQVPPEVSTCQEAVAWTFGLDERSYAPLVEA